MKNENENVKSSSHKTTNKFISNKQINWKVNNDPRNTLKKICSFETMEWILGLVWFSSEMIRIKKNTRYWQEIKRN